MTIENEFVPDKESIERQLSHMLAQKRIRTASKQAEFLKTAVTMALNGEKITEDVIGLALYPGRYIQDEMTHVRVTATSLRKTLKAYYLNEGREDQVVIRLPDPPSDRTVMLPEGGYYTPTFSYSTFYEPAQYMYVAQQLKRLRTPSAILNASANYIHVASIDSSSATARAGVAECMCVLAFYFDNTVSHKTLVDKGFDFAVQATLADQNNWSAQMAAAAACICSRAFAGATHSIGEARRINAARTGQSPWYWFLCYVFGLPQDVNKTIRDNIVDSPWDPLTISHGALVEYLNRDYETASILVNRGILLDANCWMAHAVGAFVCTSLGFYEKAIHHIDFVSSLFAESFPFMPGLRFHCTVRLKDSFSTEEFRSSIIDQWSKIKRDGARTDWFQIALASLGTAPNQLASTLGFEGLGIPGYTVRMLRYAAEDFNPLTLFLHVWPIFDPIRARGDFRKLLKYPLIPYAAHLKP